VIARLRHPIVYLITKGEAAPPTFDLDRRIILDTIDHAVNEGITLVQIREKHLTARQLFDLTIDAVAITGGSETRLLVNDRSDIAIAAKTDGVHLAANSLPADVIRRQVPKEFIIGVSTHSLAGVRSAAKGGADLAVFGPVFDTPGKGPAKGIDALAEVCREIPDFPVVGLGGVDISNFRSVMEAGSAGFAAIRSLNDWASLKSIMRELRNE
jgi:thiamine-phosphate pyrophosphorylase